MRAQTQPGVQEVFLSQTNSLALVVVKKKSTLQCQVRCCASPPPGENKFNHKPAKSCLGASEAVQIEISSPKKRSNFHNKFAPKFLVQELNSSFWRRPAAQGKFRYNLAGTMLGLSMHGNHLHVVLGRSAEMTPICTASHRRSNTTGPEVMVSAIKPPATDGTRQNWKVL